MKDQYEGQLAKVRQKEEGKDPSMSRREWRDTEAKWGPSPDFFFLLLS